MKKYLLSAVVVGGLMTLASCSTEEMPVAVGDGNVNFTLEVPSQIGTRADFGTGTKALNLSYAVYESGSQNPIIVSQNEVTFSNLRATVSLKLVNGKSYDIIWWAQSPDAKGYTFDPATQSVNISYDNIAVNDEDRDAFFQHSTYTITGPLNETVKLYRPFSQINVGTNDLSEPAVTSAFGTDLASLTTTISVNAYSTLNLLSEEASDEVTVNFVPSGIPSTDYTFPVAPYQYLSMDYILMTRDQELGTVGITVLENGTKEFNSITIPNVPLRRNYRTNIYGQLLTSTSMYEVVIEPAFNEPDYNVPLWDGSVTAPTVDEATKTVTVAGPSQLAGLAKMVNDGNSLEDYNVVLDADINLANAPWTPVGNVDRKSTDGGFKGTFDGQNHKIYNFRSVATGDNYGAGLFGIIRGGTVKNVVFESGNVTSEDMAGAVAGAILDNGTIENCINNGVTINASQAAGGIVGRLYGTTNTVKVCQNFATVFSAEKAGGIAGIASVGSSELSNCANFGKVSGGKDGVGGLLGYVGGTGATLNICSNSGAVGSASDRYVGGLVGYMQGSQPLNMTTCTNTGNVTGLKAGGLFGVVGSKQVTNFTGCANSGAVTGVDTAGGIACQFMDGTMENTTNTGTVTCTGSNSAAGGLVGSMGAATIVGSHGGSAAVSGTYSGRLVGVIHAPYGTQTAVINIPSGDSYENVANTVGSFGIAGSTSIDKLRVETGTLVGTPMKETKSAATLIIAEGASWDAFPGETGTWINSNGTWKKN